MAHSAHPTTPSAPAYPLWNGTESIEQYGKRANLPPTREVDLGSGVKLSLVLIPAGKFVMGSPAHESPAASVAMLTLSGLMILAVVITLVRKRKRPGLMSVLPLLAGLALGAWGGMRLHEALQFEKFANEQPPHEVTLTKPFYMGKYVVTQEQWEQLIGSNPSGILGKTNPVERVSWDNALEFCGKLSELTKQVVRLPTEAEWEYACRAGTTTAYYSGNTDADLARAGWYLANCGHTTHPVGQKEPNAFGLYDMHGNVWQWCEDYYGPDYYKTAPVENPAGPDQGIQRLVRGGSWRRPAAYCRSATRGGFVAPFRFSYGIGFRVVMEPAAKTP